MNTERTPNPLVMLLIYGLIVIILFAGVPVAWLSAHGAEHGAPSLAAFLGKLLPGW